MLDTPFPPWPSFTEEESSAVARVIASNRVNYWTGTESRTFEREFANWVGTSHAIALMNGTVAIDLALRALGVGPGDEVVVTPRSFIASVSSVVNAGAVPVFADVDPDSGNVTADSIERALTPRTKAVLPVHLGGWPCDMPAVMALARARGLRVIEDCAQAHGARVEGQSVGSFGEVNAWSFCQDKIMTTGGEGGMVTTNDAALWDEMWSFKDHGKSYDAVYNRKHAPGFRWLHESFGTNWRMLEVQAALGRIQLARMAGWHAARARNARAIAEGLKGLDALRIPIPEPRLEHAWYRLYAYVEPTALADGWSRDRIMTSVVAAGVPCSVGSCSEIYLEKAFENTPWRPASRLPIAKRLGETSLMFLVHPTLEERHITRTIEVVRDVVKQATR